MQQQDRCGCEKSKAFVMACAGASNVGQLSNEVALRLHQEGEAKLACLAGVGGQIGGIVESIRAAERVLVIDGCSLECGKRCLQKAGLQHFDQVVLTEAEIEKHEDKQHTPEEVERAMQLCRETLGRPLAFRY